jgi:hypothetical protein
LEEAEVAMTTDVHTFADEYLPVFDESDTVAITVDAPPARVWRTLLDTDLIEVGRRKPLVGMLGGLRALPQVVVELLHGRAASAPTGSMRLTDLPSLGAAKGGWTLLGLRPVDRIALGLIGRFWEPVITFADVPATEFATFAAPGFAKTVYELAVAPLPDGRTELTATMRTGTSDAHARRWFNRYWTLGVGPGARILARGLLDVVREDAEGRTSPRQEAAS